MLFDRFIPLIISSSLFIAWELIIFYPSKFVVFALLAMLILFALVFKLNNFKLADKDFWLLSSPGLLLGVGATVFTLFLSERLLQHLLALAAAVFCYYFLSYLYYFLRQITNYVPLSLERISSYFNFIIYFLLSVSIFGFINFLNLKPWYLTLFLMVATFILSYQFFWINKINERQSFFSAVIFSVLQAEFFWAISFFPISHFISGCCLAVLYYVFINLILLHWLEKLEPKILRHYVTLGIMCLLLVLLSARWL